MSKLKKKNSKVFLGYSYDSEHSAVQAAKRMNKARGKNVFIAIEEKSGLWLVVHINSLLLGK